MPLILIEQFIRHNEHFQLILHDFVFKFKHYLTGRGINITKATGHLKGKKKL